MSQDYKALGGNEDIRKRRFKVLQLYLRGATPPEIQHQLGEENIKTIYNDLAHLRKIRLNDLPLDIIKDHGVNFYEMKVRELQGRIAAIPKEQVHKHSTYILGLEKLIQQYKTESMKIQGAYTEKVEHSGGLNIIFEDVDATS